MLSGYQDLTTQLPQNGNALRKLYNSYSIATQIRNDTLRAETLKLIVSYYLYIDITEPIIESLIKEHESVSYDDLELCFNQYLHYKFLSESNINKGTKIFIDRLSWSKFLNRCQTLNLPYLMSKIENTRAIYYELHESNIDIAKKAYLNSIEFAFKVNNSFGNERSFIAFQNLGRMLFENDNKNESIKYFKEGLKFRDSQSDELSLIMSYKWLAQAYQENQLFDSAYYYLLLANTLNSAYQQEIQRTAVKEIQEKYQNEKLSNDLSQAELKRTQFYITSLSLGGALSVALIGIWGIRRINRLKQINLQQQIKETEQRGQLEAINAQLDGEEQERKRVASVLHDGIASHLTAASFHLQTLVQSNDSTQAADQAANLIVEAAERTRMLSHDLYPPILIKHGLVAAVEALAESYSNEGIRFQVQADQSIQFPSEEIENKLYFILSELIQNVIKHSNANTSTIRFSNSDQIRVEVIDDGNSMPQSVDPGQGLQSIISRIDSLGGTFQFETNSNGTRAIILL